MNVDFDPLFSRDARAFVPSAIRALAHLLNDPTILSFAAGAPNAETFPAEALARAAAKVLTTMPTRALQYDVTRGYAPLRERIAARSTRMGMATSGQDTILTTGSQQALDLAVRVLLDPGDIVLVEVPTYVGALVTLAARRAAPVGIRRGADGIDIEHLTATVTRLRGGGARVKALYAIPNFQNPSGLSMTKAAKDALAEALGALDLVLFEDDPYGEVRFQDGGAIDSTPIASRAPERTVYFGSFSKTLAAGLRTGWMHGPAPFLSKVELAKQAADLCSSTFDGALLDTYLSDNDYETHLELLRSFYRGRKETLLEAMREHFPGSLSWTDPGGGLFTWVTLSPGADAQALLPRCVAETRTAYVPGGPFVVEGDGRPYLRMTFAKESPANLVEGARRLGSFFRAALA